MPTLFQRLGDCRDAFYANDPAHSSTVLNLYRYTRCMEELSQQYDEFVVKALREAADYLLFSKATTIGPLCATIFLEGAQRSGWTTFQRPEEDEYRLAALMLITIEQIQKGHRGDWAQVEKILGDWLGPHPEPRHEQRTHDLATLLFGPTWTALYSGELTDARSTADAVFLTKPTFVHHRSAATGVVTPVPILPSDLTI